MFNWLFGKTTEDKILNQCMYLYPLLSKDEILNVLNNSKDMNKDTNKEVELIATLIMETLDEMNEEKRNKLKNELRASNGEK